MKIVWDEPKRLANLDKHEMDFRDLTVDFFADATVYPSHSGLYVAVGDLNGNRISDKTPTSTATSIMRS